jgi:RimJ/RimL family protein N-acetyltransferase
MTSNVSLRRASAADADFMLKVRAEPSAGLYQPLRDYSLRQLQMMLARRVSAPLDASLDSKVQWVIESDGNPAGWISLDVTSREHGIASIGYTIGESFRGHGIATQAVRLVIEIAFDPRGVALSRLEAVAAIDNAGSRRVLEKAGFREEGIAEKLLVIGGTRVDHLRFGLVRPDLLEQDIEG